MEAEDRYQNAKAMRLAFNGTPEQFETLRPLARRSDGTIDEEYDEDGLAEELASLGFVEVPRDD